jgi:hypothetical protein
MRECLKQKPNELATQHKNIRDLYRGIKEFRDSYQPRTTLLKDDNGDLLADSHILNRWKNYLPQLLNAHWVTDERQMKKHTAEPLVSEPSSVDEEISIAKLKKYRSPGSDQIPIELFLAEGEILHPQIHKIIIFIWNKDHVKWVPCHHGMARPQGTDGGDALQIWRVAANILNKPTRGGPPAW